MSIGHKLQWQAIQQGTARQQQCWPAGSSQGRAGQLVGEQLQADSRHGQRRMMQLLASRRQRVREQLADAGLLGVTVQSGPSKDQELTLCAEADP